MASLFWRQFKALFWKNWIILSKHPWLNVLQLFLLPVAYGVFLAVAQEFLIKRNKNGLGSPAPIYNLEDQFDHKLALVWVDATNGQSSPSPSEIMERITQNFSPSQKNAVRQLQNRAEIPATCPQNFNLFSECFAGIVFNDIPPPGSGGLARPVNYTIRADGGLFKIDVNHQSDFEKRIFPLQWAIDKAIIEAQTGVQVPTPLDWPFTRETNEEQDTRIRLGYIRGLRTLLVLALFICYIGIAYQLPGAFTAERATLVTAHMKAMGLLDSAKILSWHLSMSLVYLPAWTIVSLIWHYRIFKLSSAGLIFIVHIMLGLMLASYSFFVAAPFGKSPQLAATASTLLSLVFAILALVFSRAGTGAAFIFSIIFPPGWYIFVIRAICGWENHLQPSNLLKGDPDSNLMLLPLIIAGIIDIFLWPWLGCKLENHLYDAKNPKGKKSWFSFSRRPAVDTQPMNADTAISIRNLNKTFNTSVLGLKKGLVTAVSDLSLDIPKNGIFVLLGSNGAGKSTTLSVLAGLLGRSTGSVQFNNGSDEPTDTPIRGSMGIVPQKNVLFPDLTCHQTLRVWKAIKWSKNSDEKEDLEQLLKDCDLGAKIHSNAITLSGGQKRKLQLAIGLVGGSEIVLVDECTSGVDPLSRRALWRTLTSFREDRTIVFTTHFLDEADLLADHIAILAAPGKLVAQGTPVALKRDLGKGYTIQVSFDELDKDSTRSASVLEAIKREHVPEATLTIISLKQTLYHLNSKASAVVERVLQVLDDQKRDLGITSYDVLGTTIEDIFLDLMRQNEMKTTSADDHRSSTSSQSIAVTPSVSEKFASPLDLASGRKISVIRQAFTIFYKRCLIARRSWLGLVLALLVAILGSCVPLVFLRRLPPSCVRTFRNDTVLPLFLPVSGLTPAGLITFGTPNPSSLPLISPPGLTSALGLSTRFLRVTNLPDNNTFVNTVTNNFTDLNLGGVSMDLDTGVALVAWEGTSPGYKGPPMLNLASNLLYNHALNTSQKAGSEATIIRATYSPFPAVAAGTLSALRWVAFYGAAMSVFPAFFAVYVSKERISAVQAMQFSNGLTNTAGLWLGHLMFDAIFSVVSSTVIIIIFVAVSDQFHGAAYLWLVMLLYGIAGTLFAYCASLIVKSPLAAFAAVTGYQVIIFILYLAAYLLTLTYAKTSEATNIITIIHFTLSLLSPVASVTRAALVSINMFSLLCVGENLDPKVMGDIKRYGGPILYLIVYSFVLFGILVWYNSGTIRPFKGRRNQAKEGVVSEKQDVHDEAEHASSSSDLLRVLNISKAFEGKRVVDDVSLGVSRDSIFALLGPNGAGKTTTFNMIRGDVIPDEGDIFISGTSVVRHPKGARSGLGVCPQFTAIDSQLTVREHLIIYGRLKGLQSGDVLNRNVEIILRATALNTYADRLASKLSGGNQRKLSLAISLIGNPSVILIDEFSTGIDAKMKRDMWMTLRNVAVGKAVIITTHSMEEASALATKVGILAKRMLAVGTTDSLSARYGNYEVHFTCRTREDLVKAQQLMSRVPGAKLADDVATRFEVPISSETGGTSLAQLFHLLSTSEDFSEHTVEKASLESVFLKVIRENKVSEEDTQARRRRWWLF